MGFFHRTLQKAGLLHIPIQENGIIELTLLKVDTETEGIAFAKIDMSQLTTQEKDIVEFGVFLILPSSGYNPRSGSQ